MKRWSLLACCVLVLFAAAAPAFAQDGGARFGFFAGLDTKLPGFISGSGEDMGDTQYRIGAMIEPNPQILIKPDVIFVSEEENEDDKHNDHEYLRDKTVMYGGGISVYYKVLPADRVSIYVGPRIDFLQSTNESEGTSGTDT